ncbi:MULTISPECIES: phage holin family protein [Neisseria]|uniref:phage holin family protein n=1 Tax=Neisseria TaxID=482 RepID=UPI00189DF313|nr:MULTISPECIES: phage holin family protein [Neisseria]
MSNIQYIAIITLAATGALRVMLFDARGKTRKPVSVWLAYFTVLWLLGLVVAAVFKLADVAVWLLIFGLALHTGALIKARGNLSRLHPFEHKPTPPQPAAQPAQPAPKKRKKKFNPQGIYYVKK